MARYGLPKETFVIAGRDIDDGLILESPDGEQWVSNPSRRMKTERIELPLGKYEDLRMRVGLVRSSRAGKYPDVIIGGSQHVYDLMKTLSAEPQEILSVIMLDHKNRVIGIQEIARGGLGSAVVEPKLFFQAPILADASNIILVHNHPSGAPEPSTQDRQLTKMLYEAGQLLGFTLLDHLVIGADSYVSFADREML